MAGLLGAFVSEASERGGCFLWLDMRKTFRFKLYRSKKNRRLREKIAISSEIYNHCIALHRRYYRLFEKSLQANQLKIHITKLKRRFSHWKFVGSQAIQDIVERIDFGYKKFFRKENKCPPSFRKRSKYKSFTLKQAGWKLLGGHRIKIGTDTYRFFKSREIEGIIKTVTIKRDPLGDLYVFFSCELAEVQLELDRQGQTSIGLDFGLKTFLTPSVGEPIESPFFFKKGLQAIKSANRSLSLKQKGSKARERAKRHLTRTHQRIANQRRDYQFKLAQALSERYEYLFFEDLNIKGMQKLWGKKINDLAFSEYLRIQKWQAQKVGSTVIQIDRFFPSSKQCHQCRYIKSDLSLKERQWQCPQCGSFHQRDRNAAINIHTVGASTVGIGNIRPLRVAIPA
jgi:putative transposase